MSRISCCDRCKGEIPTYEPVASFDWVIDGLANPLPRLHLELCLRCAAFLDQYMRTIKA